MRTKLDRVLAEHGISTLRLVRETKKIDPEGHGYSRNHVYGIRRGEAEPTRPCMSALLIATRRLTGNRQLKIDDLFEFADHRRKAS